MKYEPASILITGGAGFIASHVAARLMKKYPKYQVRVIGKTYQDLLTSLYSRSQSLIHLSTART